MISFNSDAFLLLFLSRWPVYLGQWYIKIVDYCWMLICVFNSNCMIFFFLKKLCGLEFGAYIFKIVISFWLISPLIRMKDPHLFLLISLRSKSILPDTG